MIAERERADQAVAAAPAPSVVAVDTEELERLRAELREERQRADDAMGSIDRLRSATTSHSSASQMAEVEIGNLRDQLRAKNRELDNLHKELATTRSDFQEVEAVAVQHLVEKDKLTLEIKSMTETIARYFCCRVSVCPPFLPLPLKSKANGQDRHADCRTYEAERSQPAADCGIGASMSIYRCRNWESGRCHAESEGAGGRARAV